jgi:predicted ATP-dependent serine protease
VIEYIVEFMHLMPSNLTPEALGGLNAKDLDWTLELEPFSTFSYSVMRNNIFALCVDDNFTKMRDAIIYMKAPKNPQLEQVNELHRRFRKELKVLNPEQ